jgi:hypothetical protein
MALAKPVTLYNQSQQLNGIFAQDIFVKNCCLKAEGYHPL